MSKCMREALTVVALVVWTAMISLLYGFHWGARTESKKQHESNLATLNQDADTTNSHVIGDATDIGAEIMAVNRGK